MLLCGSIVVCAILASWPIAELGADDDWSYVKTALDLARTGQFHYNGWATTMLGAQAYWGAGIIKLFGFSFTKLRLSLLPAAAGCAGLLFRIGRRSGLNAAWALLITLTATLSPVFVFSATNFSSDVPGFLCLLACANLTASAVSDRGNRVRRRIAQLGAVAVIGFIGGTIRQVVWGMPLICLVYAAWCHRQHWPTVLSTGGMMVALGGGILLCESWYHAQPYALPEYFLPTANAWLAGLPQSLVPLLSLLLSVAMLSLPVMAGALPAMVRLIGPAKKWPWLVIAGAATAPIPLLGMRAVGPWLGNIVTTGGIDAGLDAVGKAPEVLPLWLCVLLSVSSTAALATVALAWLCYVAQRGKGGRSTAPAEAGHAGLNPSERSEPQRYGVHALRILIAYSIGYVALILIRSNTVGLFDRYLLPLTAIAGLWIGHITERGQARVPWPAWALLGLFTYYSVASTHDYFAALRARIAAATALERRGVSRTRITAGMAYDGWTELLTTGYINDARIRIPPGAFHPHPRTVAQGQTDFWFWEWTPSLRPAYFVVNSPQNDLAPTPVGPFPYTAWLAPFGRAVFVQATP